MENEPGTRRAARRKKSTGLDAVNVMQSLEIFFERIILGPR
jgi:hypothetical protein